MQWQFLLLSIITLCTKVLLFSLACKEQNLDLAGVSNLAKVEQLVRGGAEIQSQALTLTALVIFLKSS